MYSMYCYSKHHRVFLKQSMCLHMFLNEVSTAGHTVKMFWCDGGKELAYEEFVVSKVIMVLHCCCRC